MQEKIRHVYATFQNLDAVYNTRFRPRKPIIFLSVVKTGVMPDIQSALKPHSGDTFTTREVKETSGEDKELAELRLHSQWTIE